MLLHKDITEKIISSFYTVYNELGFGFLEKVYENALFLEMQKKDLLCETQKHIKVYYKGEEVGLLLSFGKEAKFIRKIFTNDNKEEHKISEKPV